MSRPTYFVHVEHLPGPTHLYAHGRYYVLEREPELVPVQAMLRRLAETNIEHPLSWIEAVDLARAQHIKHRYAPTRLYRVTPNFAEIAELQYLNEHGHAMMRPPDDAIALHESPYVSERAVCIRLACDARTAKKFRHLRRVGRWYERADLDLYVTELAAFEQRWGAHRPEPVTVGRPA